MTDPRDFEQARDHFIAGVGHFEAGRYADAETAFRASLAALPGRPSTLSNLGATLLKLQRPQEALPLLDQALASAPEDAQAIGHRAHVLNLMRRHGEALAGLEQFIALAPERPEGWFHHAQTLQLIGETARALDSYERAVALAPEHAQAWSGRGGALKDLGRDAEAVASFERAIALGADAELHRYYLASLGSREAPPTAPQAFVRNLFDSYAEGFDEHLVQTLGYRAPERLLQLALAAGGGRSGFRSALDLGCGTGLCGVRLRAVAHRLEGVDLSAPMLAAAAQRGVYDELHHAEIAAHLEATPRRHDLVVAADVTIYLGDLQPLFAGVARVLDGGGLFAFSTEAADHARGGYVLQPSMRYAHAERYLRDLAARNGLEPLHVERGVIRSDRGQAIAGDYVVLGR